MEQLVITSWWLPLVLVVITTAGNGSPRPLDAPEPAGATAPVAELVLPSSGNNPLCQTTQRIPV